jgi:hypothetical protein
MESKLDTHDGCIQILQPSLYGIAFSFFSAQESMPQEAVFRPQPKARKQQLNADSSSEEEEEEDTSSEEEEEEEEGGTGREAVVGVLKAGLAIKNPPKKNHLKSPLKMGFLGFF